MRKLQSFIRTFPRYTASQKESVYRPLLLQCGPEETACRWTFPRKIRTFFVCWPDHTNPCWTVLFWTVFSLIFYLADMGADLSVAFEYFDSGDYIWFGLLFGFSFLPIFVSIFYNIFLKGKVWYEVYPVGIFYWSYLTIRGFLNVPRINAIATIEDAKNYIVALRTYQDYNRERTRCGDLDIYFGAMPQIILQSYIAAEMTMKTGYDALSWTTWISLALSSFSLLRYEPSSRISKKGIIIDIETVLEPARYDYIMDNLFDLMSIVPRAVAIGVCLTINPLITAPVFFSLHLVITFLWFWLSAPKRIPGYRHSYMDHMQASLATLVFPPTHRAWPENFRSLADRIRAVFTLQFTAVTIFQLVETICLLAVWVFFLEAHIRVVPTLFAVVSWTVARIICHISYYVFILFPLYFTEWEGCGRRRGLMAKMEIIRMAEEIGGYFCPKLRPRLERVRDLCAITVDRSTLRTECIWLMDQLVNEVVGRQTPTMQRSRTQKHRMQSMVTSERDLLRSAEKEAARCLKLIDSGEGITESDRMVWDVLLHECERLILEWCQILLLCLTHQKLPLHFLQGERDLGLAQYPEMFQKFVMKNDLLARRRESNSKSPTPQRALRITTANPSNVQLYQPAHESLPTPHFGRELNFESIT